MVSPSVMLHFCCWLYALLVPVDWIKTNMREIQKTNPTEGDGTVEGDMKSTAGVPAKLVDEHLVKTL